MYEPDDCPYKGLNMCQKCPRFNHDTAECMSLTAASAANRTDVISTSFVAQTYEERLSDYEQKRAKLLKLSKEALVDLILEKPSYF
jgi:hypothetical protein